MKKARDRYKGYVDKRRRPLEFDVEQHVFLKVSSIKGVIRFGTKGKLNPRYVEHYEILDKIGPVPYRLTLPPSLSGVHDVFHVQSSESV